jgi:hypothetical protein
MGPFGLWMGMSLEEIGSEGRELAPAKYKIATVPKPHSAFETYIAMVTPKNGLCWVKVLSPTLQTNVFGASLRAAFDSMEEKLTATYGKSKRTDFIMSGSIWSDPQYWMQSLISQDRFLATEWAPKHGSTLKDSLTSVALIVSTTDTTAGYIAVEYSFENMKSAEAELAAAEDDAL